MSITTTTTTIISPRDYITSHDMLISTQYGPDVRFGTLLVSGKRGHRHLGLEALPACAQVSTASAILIRRQNTLLTSEL